MFNLLYAQARPWMFITTKMLVTVSEVGVLEVRGSADPKVCSVSSFHKKGAQKCISYQEPHQLSKSDHAVPSSPQQARKGLAIPAISCRYLHWVGQALVRPPAWSAVPLPSTVSTTTPVTFSSLMSKSNYDLKTFSSLAYVLFPLTLILEVFPTVFPESPADTRDSLAPFPEELCQGLTPVSQHS